MPNSQRVVMVHVTRIFFVFILILLTFSRVISLFSYLLPVFFAWW